MRGKFAVLCFVSLVILPARADAGFLDILNKVEKVTKAIDDTQRTLNGKPVAPGEVAEAGKHSTGSHVTSHVRKHK